jgi:uncharacterized protein with von Willebrand factor type A (vWA) domain
MEVLTLEKAAEKHSTHAESPVGSRLYTYKNEAFKAGVEWQKEQYKELKEALELGCGYMKLYLKRMGQNPALGPEPGSALDKVNKAIERLQD